MRISYVCHFFYFQANDLIFVDNFILNLYTLLGLVQKHILLCKRLFPYAHVITQNPTHKCDHIYVKLDPRLIYHFLSSACFIHASFAKKRARHSTNSHTWRISLLTIN